MVENFNLKYMLKKFSDVVNMKITVNLLKQMILKDMLPPGLIFQGPPGTGKSALARLMAKSLLCLNRSRDSLEPCGKCPHCLWFDGLGGHQPFGYFQINCPRVLDFSTYNKLFDYFIYAPPLNNEYWIVLLQEFQRTAPQVRDMFLDALEWHRREVLFLFTVVDIKADKIDTAFRQRCILIQTCPPSREAILPWLRKLCFLEDIRVADEKIFELIADYGSNVPRECLAALDRLKFIDNVFTVSLVKEILQI